ncbi:MAG TPA: imelysin family protein, partial [Stellaceae bacterium]|nr:imelysin family protein [Stellaceae bacterium]
PQGLLNGVARLAYEVGENKSDGGESPFSGTSLDDMRYNAYGIQSAYNVIFAAALKSADPALADLAEKQIAEMKSLLDNTSDLKSLDQDKLRTASEELVVSLQNAAPKLGLRTPTMEEIQQ